MPTFDDPISMVDETRFDYVKNFTDPMSWVDTVVANSGTSFDDPMSWTDDTRLDYVKNFTDPLSLPDTIMVMPMIIFDDPMNWLDDVTINFEKNFDDPISWTDETRFDYVKNFTDPLSLPDTLIVMSMPTFDDPISMVDETRFDYVKNFTDPMSWLDDVTINFGKTFQDNMTMTDDIVSNVGTSFDDPMSWLDDTRLDYVKNFTDPLSLPDEVIEEIVIFDTDPMSFVDDINVHLGKKDNPLSFTDGINTFQTFGQPVIIVPPPDVTVTGGGGVGGQPTPTIPDSDGDGFLDNEDNCPLEPENFNGFQDLDGCPDVFDQPEPLTIFDLGFPFGFNELDVVDDFINLETDSPQPQIEDLGIRWLGDEPITIESIIIGDSPFEFQIQDLPITFGNNQFGYTQEQVIYTVQESDNLCTNGFSVDCLDEITYEIPIQITGEVRGKTVVANGSITIDNSNRFNPYWYVLILLVLIPVIAFFLWKRRKRKPTTRTLLKVTQAPRTRTVVVTRSKPLKTGTTRRLLTESEKSNILGKKTK